MPLKLVPARPALPGVASHGSKSSILQCDSDSGVVIK
jgi:hypothetical protein